MDLTGANGFSHCDRWVRWRAEREDVRMYIGFMLIGPEFLIAGERAATLSSSFIECRALVLHEPAFKTACAVSSTLNPWARRSQRVHNTLANVLSLGQRRLLPQLTHIFAEPVLQATVRREPFVWPGPRLRNQNHLLASPDPSVLTKFGSSSEAELPGLALGAGSTAWCRIHPHFLLKECESILAGWRTDVILFGKRLLEARLKARGTCHVDDRPLDLPRKVQFVV